MRERPSHTTAGIMFIMVCVAVAVAIYIGSHAMPQTAVDNTPVTDNLAAEDRGPDVAGEPDVKSGDVEALDVVDPSEIGQCRDGACAVARELDRETVRSTPNARLIRLSLLGGTADENGAATWQTEAHTVYVFCSAKLPAVIMRDGDRWQVDVLDQVQGPPTVLDSSQSIYKTTCHAGDAAFPGNAAALGYTAIADDRLDPQIAAPEDLFAVIEDQ